MDLRIREEKGREKKRRNALCTYPIPEGLTCDDFLPPFFPAVSSRDEKKDDEAILPTLTNCSDKINFENTTYFQMT